MHLPDGGVLQARRDAAARVGHARGAPVVEALAVSLAKWSREELVAIIERMAALHPELESLATPPTARGRGRSSTDWGEVVGQAMRSAGRDWGQHGPLPARSRVSWSRRRAPSRGGASNAVEACRAVIDAALDARRNGDEDESEGKLLGPVIKAAKVLGERLTAMKASDELLSLRGLFAAIVKPHKRRRQDRLRGAVRRPKGPNGATTGRRSSPGRLRQHSAEISSTRRR